LDEQKKFVCSVLEQTVLTPDGILIIQVHGDTGDASAVCSDLVDRCGKLTAAQLAASKLESKLAGFRMDASWKKTNLAFLIAWRTAQRRRCARRRPASRLTSQLVPQELGMEKH
jgi:hypothetical protein